MRDIMIHFGNRLRELRTSCDWSQQDLADRLEISKQAISNWERDAAKPDINQLVRLAEVFNISADSLLGMDKNPSYFHPQGRSQLILARSKHWDWIFQDSYDLIDVLQSGYQFHVGNRPLSTDELNVYCELIKVTERALAKKETAHQWEIDEIVSEVEEKSELKADINGSGKVSFQ
jgi:transcriptional regulator with XRE-family HTH domain